MAGTGGSLCHRTELSPTDTYLHLDLEQIVAANDIESYVIFHRFFSRSAFERHDGRERLSQYKQQSEQASKVIEDHLSLHVEEIARQLCQGLVESCRAAGEDVTAPGTRKEIYKNALYLVYRLLFVLYAEARDLLPLDIPAYQAVCLRDLLAEVRENHWNGLHYADDHAIWERLQRLFALIDQGDNLAGVPAYNGGLFDPGRRPFLTGHRIENLYLQAALIRLSTMPAKGLGYDQDREPTPIDYRDLSVRHLGSLYEGLLEYNLFEVKDEPRVVRASNKRTEYVPYSQAGKVRAGETLLKVGDVYFSETEGERKATGSYYTPEDVVDYIVRNTVMVKLAELRAEFYKAKGIERQLQDLADTPPDLPAYRQIQLELDRQFLSFVNEQVLSLKILDMAMGSGHFLVNATHAVANFIVEFLNETPWENEGIDTDVATWRRRVAERCIFGVDLNELAVELAKLCLWMTTAARGKPLTFLDHHLRWGNSLVGAWMKDVGVYPLAKERDKPAFTLPLGAFQVALDQVFAGYQELYALNSDDVEEVRQKARIYDQEIRSVLERYRELFDLHIGVYFGNGIDDTSYGRLGMAVRDATTWTALKAEINLSSSWGADPERRWFHWELEFPEFFADVGKTVSGVGAIVGNPPYASLPASLPTRFISTEYKTASCGDLYALFVERSVQVRNGGSAALGFIVPLSITFSSRLASLREQLKQTKRLWRLHSFDKRPQAIFPNVQQRTCIVFGYPTSGESRVESGPLTRWKPADRATLFVGLRTYDCTDLILDLGIPKLGSHLQARALKKLLAMKGSLSANLLVTEDDLDLKDLDPLTIHFFGVAYRWLAAAKRLPPSVSPTGEPVHLTGFSQLIFKDKETAWSYLGVLNSQVAFWFWLLYGDSFHVTGSLLKSLPIDITLLSGDGRRQLESLGRQIDEEMAQHVFYAKMQGRVTANYNLLECRHITDQIDELLVNELDLGKDFLQDLRTSCATAAGVSGPEALVSTL